MTLHRGAGCPGRGGRPEEQVCWEGRTRDRARQVTRVLSWALGRTQRGLRAQPDSELGQLPPSDDIPLPPCTTRSPLLSLDHLSSPLCTLSKPARLSPTLRRQDPSLLPHALARPPRSAHHVLPVRRLPCPPPPGQQGRQSRPAVAKTRLCTSVDLLLSAPLPRPSVDPCPGQAQRRPPEPPPADGRQPARSVRPDLPGGRRRAARGRKVHGGPARARRACPPLLLLFLAALVVLPRTSLLTDPLARRACRSCSSATTRHTA